MVTPDRNALRLAIGPQRQHRVGDADRDAATVDQHGTTDADSEQ
jgi:hypothetical protein